MNSLEPSDVLALFRATSRKLFLPKFTFSALIVSKCTSSFRRLLSSDSIVVRPPNQGTGPLVTEGGPTDVSDINLLDERRSTTQATPGTAALNIASSSFGRNAVRPLRRDLRGTVLSPLRRTGPDDVPAVGGPARSGRLAVPPLWHLVRRELLPAVRPPEGSLGSASGSGFLRPAHPHDPVDACNRRIR